MSRATGGAGGWRAPILRHFTPQIAVTSRLTIAADPDRLLAEQTLLEEIRERGFDLIPFTDPIAFRYAYERQYRQRWDRGEETALVVLLRSEREDLSTLPFDLLQTARRNDRLLRFSLVEIFPYLSPNVVAQLDPAHFDTLHEAVSASRTGEMGERATSDFMLRHVFETSPEQLRSPEDLTRMLLRRHYRNRQLPTLLDERLIAQLRELGRFPDWPLEQIVPDREAFFAFLQERWPVFLRRQVKKLGKKTAGEPLSGYSPAIPGPVDLPFGHEDVRVYVDNLFIEGHLTPTDEVAKADVKGTWLEWGVAGAEEEDQRRRFAKLSESLSGTIPAKEAGYREWIDFARCWAEWTALRMEGSVNAAEPSPAEELWSTADEHFTAWMQRHYPSLHNLAYLPRPAMVHQVPRYLAHGWTPAQRQRKVALLVIDGLAWSQWIPLRASLGASESGPYGIHEEGVFAWVPTITPVSRQAIFAGEPPLYFRPSIGTTGKDEQHWRRFWEDRQLRGNDIQFLTPRSKETDEARLARITAAADHPSCVVLGIVIPIVDEMMHGAVTGSRGLHAQVAYWASEGHFGRIIETLVERDFSVWITSDHGSLECIGIGKPNVGVLAEERGERVHIFGDELVRQKVHEQYSGTLLWPQVGLPEDYRPLLATGRGAFISEGKRTISHGGISLEEVIVPFIAIERK